jgi:hypothetical protein
MKEENKVFLSEEKTQKTFAISGVCAAWTVRDSNREKSFGSFVVAAQVPMLPGCFLPRFGRSQMNAALRICPAWRSILMRTGEILNAVFICRHKKESPGWTEAGPPRPPSLSTEGAIAVRTNIAPGGLGGAASPHPAFRRFLPGQLLVLPKLAPCAS